MSTSLLLAFATAAGAAAGVFLDPSTIAAAHWLTAVFLLTGFVAAARGLLATARVFVVIAFVPISTLIASSAQTRAIHPPLRQFLEDRIGGYVIDSTDVARHDSPIELEGRLTADAFATGSGASLRMEVLRVSAGACMEPTSGGVSLTVAGALATAGELEKWRAGRVVRTTASLRRPANYLDHGLPDLERMMARRGIALVGTVKSASLVQVVSHGTWLDEAASSIRSVVRRAITRHVGTRDAQSAAIAVAILIGDRGALDPLVEQRLQEAGTYHVIAISGGNIAILAGLILGGLWIVQIRGGWAAGAAIGLLIGYAFVAGGGPSVIRATTMAAIYLALRLIDQKTAPLHAMSITLVGVLLAAPMAIADVGLWLTFGATAAIVAAAAVTRLPSTAWFHAPAALCIASLSAELALIPIAAFIFQRITIAGLAVNLVAIPCMAVVQVAAMITAAADAVDLTSMAQLAGGMTHLGVRGLLESARLVDMAPWLTWRVPSPHLLIIAAYYLALVAALALKKWHAPAAVAAALLLWIVIAPATLARTFGDGSLHLTMMDVGQGDATLVTFPDGKTLLVDAGGVSLSGDFDIGDRVLGPALRARGVTRLDYLAITHGDPDHIGGAASIVRDFRPKEIWYGTYVNNHDPSMALQSLALKTRSTWRWLIAGDRLEIGGVELRIHHPGPVDWQRQKVRNDDSLVIELRHERVSTVLTGDIGREVEATLLPSLDLLPVVVLKSPHHGSATSSSDDFVGVLKPRVVLISCGRANPYGHPVAKVLERYSAARSRVFRTDLDGQIELTTNGWSIQVETFNGRRVPRA
jgi:competence protein ComEC